MIETAEAPPLQMPQPPGASEIDQGLGESLSVQAAGMLSSMRRLVDLQIGIWLARAKLAVFRIVLFVALALMALLLAFAALVWGYAGLYRILTDVLHFQTAWALVIFAGLHLLLSAILGLIAVSLLRGPKGTPKSPEAVA